MIFQNQKIDSKCRSKLYQVFESSDSNNESEELKRLVDINDKNIEHIDEDSQHYWKLQDWFENIPSYKKRNFKRTINDPSFNLKQFKKRKTNVKKKKIVL